MMDPTKPVVVRKGDFLVRERALDEAEDAFAKNSKQFQKRDLATRAPIESDVDVWRRNQRGLDFPGVDTPTDAPRERALDLPLPGERSKGGGSDVILAPDAERPSKSRSEQLDEIFEPVDRLLDL